METPNYFSNSVKCKTRQEIIQAFNSFVEKIPEYKFGNKNISELKGMAHVWDSFFNTHDIQRLSVCGEKLDKDHNIFASRLFLAHRFTIGNTEHLFCSTTMRGTNVKPRKSWSWDMALEENCLIDFALDHSGSESLHNQYVAEKTRFLFGTSLPLNGILPFNSYSYPGEGAVVLARRVKHANEELLWGTPIGWTTMKNNHGSNIKVDMDKCLKSGNLAPLLKHIGIDCPDPLYQWPKEIIADMVCEKLSKNGLSEEFSR